MWACVAAATSSHWPMLGAGSLREPSDPLAFVRRCTKPDSLSMLHRLGGLCGSLSCQLAFP